MTPEQFCYWLHGYTEISGRLPSPEEWRVIIEHLDLVFHKVTPPKQVLTEKELRDVLTVRPDVFCSPGKIC